MFSTPLLRRAELVAPVRCRGSTSLTSSPPGAKISSVGIRLDGSYRSKRTATSSVASSPSSSSPRPRLRFRRGKPSDAPTLFKLVLNEKMLPFGLRPERFIIAETDEDEGGRLVSFGQLAELEGEGDGSPLLFELRSLVTVPELRGRGIGAEVVGRLLEEASSRKEGKRGARVIMTTIGRRVPFYERLGFTVLSPPPKELSLEIAVGSVVARAAVGDSIVAMGREL